MCIPFNLVNADNDFCVYVFLAYSPLWFQLTVVLLPTSIGGFSSKLQAQQRYHCSQEKGLSGSWFHHIAQSRDDSYVSVPLVHTLDNTV